MGLEKGTTIFNERGEEREVALDRRDKGGNLWAVASWGQNDHREQLKHGVWLAKNPENATAHMFVQATETSVEPLQEEAAKIRKRISALRSFARLVVSAAAYGTVRVSLIADAEVGAANTDTYDFERELEDKLGEPISDDEQRWVTHYEASVSGLPDLPVVTVVGTNGKTHLLFPPEDYKS